MNGVLDCSICSNKNDFKNSNFLRGVVYACASTYLCFVPCLRHRQEHVPLVPADATPLAALRLYKPVCVSPDATLAALLKDFSTGGKQRPTATTTTTKALRFLGAWRGVSVVWS